MNPFGVFSVAEISAAINKLPNRYGMLNEKGVFPVKGLVNATVVVEERNGVLSLIPVTLPKAPSGTGVAAKRTVRTFSVPRLTEEDTIKPEDVQGLRAFGGETQENLATLLNDKLETCRAKHDITLEWLRMGALKGILYDADGTTVIYNLYTEFGITQKTVDFVLGTAGTDVKAKCLEVARHIEDNLLGENHREVEVLVSQEFFDKLTGHAKVQAAFDNWQAAQDRLGGDMRSGFTFGGLKFIEYRGNANYLGANKRFIASGDGHAYPVGTSQTFRTFVAPANFNETVGQMGQLYYAKTVPAKFDQGYDVHTQSNPLPMCMRPGVLVRVYTSN